MEYLWQYIGFAAFLIMFPVNWLQVWTNYTRKSTEGVSTAMFITLFIGLSMMFAVAVHDNSTLAIVFNFGFGAVGAFVVLYQIYLYRKNKTGGAK